jgi:hypothetical protein
MSSCKHFIISNSSYSYWAAYLAHNSSKYVIHPRLWYKDNPITAQHIGLVPNNWLEVEN